MVIFPFVVLVGILLPFFSDKGEPIKIMGFLLDSWGLHRFFDICMKASLSVISLTILLETTAFPDILKGLELLRVPQLMIAIISFIYRYFIIILKEGKRMKIARDVRSRGGSFSWQVKTMGSILGQLFIRSFERSERIYQAMVVRGYSGSIRTVTTFQVSVKDALLLVAACMALCIVKVIT
jgi:cobalt/nickel transport system permease protein